MAVKSLDTGLTVLEDVNVSLPDTLGFLMTIGGVGEVLREVPKVKALSVFRNMGLHQPEQLTATDNFTLAAADSGRLILLNAATPKTITLSNVGAVRVFYANIGTAVWTLTGQTSMTGATTISPNKSGKLEKLSANNWMNESTEQSNERLKELTQAEAYMKLVPTPEPTDTARIASWTVKWPDGATGVLTNTNYDSDLDVYLGYTVTYIIGGVTKTITQPAATVNPDDSLTYTELTVA